MSVSVVHRIEIPKDIPKKGDKSEGLSLKAFKKLQEDRNNGDNYNPESNWKKPVLPKPVAKKVRTPLEIRFEHIGLEATSHDLFCENNVLKKENEQLRHRQFWLEQRVQNLEVTVGKLKEVNAELQEEACLDSWSVSASS